MLNLIIEGQVNYNTVRYYIDGKWIRKGQSPYGDIIFTIH